MGDELLDGYDLPWDELGATQIEAQQRVIQEMREYERARENR